MSTSSHSHLLDLYSFTQPRLAELIKSWGFADVHVARLWRYLYRDRAASVSDLAALPARLRERIEQEACLGQLNQLRETQSSDRCTRKFLLALSDGAVIETVLMQMRDRLTVCLSSQAGCPLGCVFCATGQAGFTRNLTAGEIVAQVLYVERLLQAERAGRVRNIAVMGMGEPLLNYDAVIGALDIVHDSGGLALSGKHITLSTVGVAPGIVRLADERRPFSLAVSLHAANQEERAALVPAACTWPLDELIDACRYYTRQLDRRIFFEWTLIAGANDSIEHARQLCQLLHDVPSQVNLIPLNPTVGYSGTPGQAVSLDGFYQVLREAGVSVSVRQRRGIDIAAGCGQLVGAR